MTQNRNSLPKGYILKSPHYEYRIESVIGSGGFGITYLATAHIKVGNVSLKAKFAIKEHFISNDCERETATSSVVYSNPAKERVENSLKDFISEAKRLHKIGVDHNNIVKVNEVFEANNTAYYVMEYLEGESLRSYIKKNGPLDEGTTRLIMDPIMEVARYLHKNRMTHLDIKPDNVMLTQDEQGQIRPVLIDFGLSKHYDKNGRPTSTINTLGCSQGYAPIEQYAGITIFSPSADIYALGATMWFCLTGKDPEKSVDISPSFWREGLPANISEQTISLIENATKTKKEERVLSRYADSQDSNKTIQLTPSNNSNNDNAVLRGNNASSSKRKTSKYLIIGIITAVVIIGLSILIFIKKGNEDHPKEAEETILAYPGSRVSDTNHLLSSEQKMALNRLNDSVSEATGLQVISLILRNSHSNNFKAFSDSVFNAWGIGSSKENNGVLIAIDVENGQTAVSIGSGVSTPEIESTPIWDYVVNSMIADCKNGDYYKAFLSGSKAVGRYPHDYSPADYNALNMSTAVTDPIHNNDSEPASKNEPKENTISTNESRSIEAEKNKPMPVSGSAKQMYSTGKKMMDSGNYQEGWQNILAAAKAGYGPAQDEAGSMYWNGHIDPNDNFVGYSRHNNATNQKKAYDWWRKAAANNVGFSQLMIGDAYLNGLAGFPRDTAQAVKYYKLAKVNGSKRWASQALEKIPAKYK
ncbi:MAG: TPM domain-containing protein [Muribaculaceae bacterium]|nr:TPM domain-containing protein [Muribaculaceae bacterium]